MINWNCAGPVRIAAIGECMIERRADADGSPAFSGDTLNTLTYMARLLGADRAELCYVTAVGEDRDSAAMLAAWQAEGVNTHLVRCFRDKLPGSYTISVGPGGERRFSYDRNESAARELFRDAYDRRLARALGDFKALYLSGISAAILHSADREKLLALLQTLRQAGVIIVYDPNYRAALWASPAQARDWAEQVCRVVDVALPGFDDEKALFDDATPEHSCARLVALGIAEVIVKNGSLPCTVSTGSEVVRFPVAARPRLVDTTAAGDSFNAGYLAARLRGHDLAASVRAGQRLAERVIQYPGAIIPRAATPALARILRQMD